MAISGMHALMYSKKDRETREFLRDVLGFSSVDAGRGWLIFTAPPAELAVHPTEREEYHELYLMCDNLESTAADLRTKGVEIGEINEQPWGRVTTIPLPSGATLRGLQPQ